MQLFVARDFVGDRLKMLFYFLHMFLDPTLVLFEQLQAFGYGLLTPAQEFGIALDIANRHPCCSQALEKLNPGHMLVTKRSKDSIFEGTFSLFTTFGCIKQN